MPNSSRHTSPINGPLNTDGPVPPRLRGSPFLAGVTPSPPNQSPYSFVSTGNISDSALPQSIASGPWLDFVELPQTSGSTTTLHQPKYTHAPSSQTPSFVGRSGSTPRASSVGGTRPSFESSNISPYQYASSSSPTSSVPSLGSTSADSTPSSSPPSSTATLSSPRSSSDRPGTPIPQVNPSVSYPARAKSPLGTALHIPIPNVYPSFSSAPPAFGYDDDDDALDSGSEEYFEASASSPVFVIPPGQLRRRGQSTPSLGTTANMSAYFGAGSLPPAVRERLEIAGGLNRPGSAAAVTQ